MGKEQHFDLQGKFFDLSKTLSDTASINLPVTTLKQAIKFGKRILDTDNVNGYGLEDSTAIGNITTGSKYNMLNNATGAVNNGNMVSSFEHNGKIIGPKKMNLKKNAKAKATIIDQITTSLNIGSRVKVPLYHSGIVLAMEPPKASDLNKLLIKLNDCRLSIVTNSRAFLHTNNKILLDSILVDFIVSKIMYTSLKLPAGETITKYISILDTPTLVMVIVSAMYPNGHNFNISCKNSVVVKDGLPSCNYNVSGVVDVDEALRVDRDRLTPYMVDILSSEDKDSITVEDVAKYKEELNRINSVNNNLTITLPNEAVLVLTMEHKNIYDYHRNGKKWLNRILDDVDRILESSVTNREKVIDDIILYNSCSSYKELISSVTFNNTTTTDPKDIEDILINLSEAKETRENFNKQIRTYLEKSSITIVGFSNFICPVCAAKQSERHEGHVWNTINPIDPFEYFLELGVSKITSLV